MAVIEVYSEVGRKGQTVAHIPDWLGCLAWGETPDEAMAALPEAFDGHVARLRGRGLPLEWPRGRRRFEVVEEVYGLGPANGSGPSAYFSWDEKPLSRTEMARMLHLMEASRGWVNDVVTNLHPRALSWKPGAGQRSIRKTLSYIETKERWFVSRLGLDVPKPKERSMLDLWRMTRDRIVDALRQLDAQQRSAVYVPRRGAANAIEKWTARRVFRRIVEHERAQLEAIKAIIDGYNAQRQG